jgi:hypothetical protein
VLQSHTATQQWQSFEMRMRQRRVERCLLRASVAIEAGVLEDAREAIDEVRRLSPDEPALEPLAAQFARAEQLPAIERLPHLVLQPELAAADAGAAPAILQTERRRFPTMAAMVLATAAAGGGWWWSATHVAPAPSQVVTAPTVPQPTSGTVLAPAPSAPAVQIDRESVTAALREEVRPEASTTATTGSLPLDATAPLPVPLRSNVTPGAQPFPGGPLTTPGSLATPSQPAAVTDRNASVSRPGGPLEPRAEIDTRNSAPARLPGAEMTPTAPPAPSITARVEPPTALPAPVENAPRVVAGADGIGEPAATPRVVPAAPAPPAASNTAPAVHADEQGVRAALSRYESAYTRLDAAAAASVFPSVNRRALATAFEGLSAQTISLGRCDVRLAGATAQAYCEGNARWTPKVGGGTKTSGRQWRFDLRNTNGNWLITQATAK